MARKVRPVHCWGVVKRDFINIKGFGDCRVLTDPRYLSDKLDIIQFWVKTPLYQAYSVCVPEESYINVVEFVDDDDEEFTEEIERVMMCELRKGDKFYFGSGQVKLIEQTSFMHFLLRPMNGRKRIDIDMRIIPTKVVRRVKKVRKTKPLSFTEFALSSYEKALGRLAKAVMRLQMDPTRVEVQKPAKKAEDTSIITAEDVPAPVETPIRNYGPKAFDCDCDEDCDRSYCVERDPVTLDTVLAGHYDDRVLTCSDVIAELEEVRLHEGDLPVSIVSPEDGFRRVNVSGSMLEDLYECGETYWGSRTWDTQPRPKNPDKSELVVSLW